MPSDSDDELTSPAVLGVDGVAEPVRVAPELGHEIGRSKDGGIIT